MMPQQDVVEDDVQGKVDNHADEDIEEGEGEEKWKNTVRMIPLLRISSSTVGEYFRASDDERMCAVTLWH